MPFDSFVFPVESECVILIDPLRQSRNNPPSSTIESYHIFIFTSQIRNLISLYFLDQLPHHDIHTTQNVFQLSSDDHTGGSKNTPVVHLSE